MHVRLKAAPLLARAIKADQRYVVVRKEDNDAPITVFVVEATADPAWDDEYKEVLTPFRCISINGELLPSEGDSEIILFSFLDIGCTKDGKVAGRLVRTFTYDDELHKAIIEHVALLPEVWEQLFLQDVQVPKEAPSLTPKAKRILMAGSALSGWSVG